MYFSIVVKWFHIISKKITTSYDSCSFLTSWDFFWGLVSIPVLISHRIPVLRHFNCITKETTYSNIFKYPNKHCFRVQKKPVFSLRWYCWRTKRNHTLTWSFVLFNKQNYYHSTQQETWLKMLNATLLTLVALKLSSGLSI